MPTLPFSENLVAQLSRWVAEYISDQRTRFYGEAGPLSGRHKQLMQPFFPDDVLDLVRVIRGLAGEPKFYAQLRTMGVRNAPPFSQMAGITFQDVVVHNEALNDALLFHELVHAVQYKHLGVQGFANLYVRGFFTGGSYEEIPLEKQAYALEAKFSANPAAPFSVEDDVAHRISAKQF